MTEEKPQPAPSLVEGQGEASYVLGEELTAHELERVDRAVAHLNATVSRRGVELACEVSRYVLDAFFEGRYAAFAEPNRYKPRSFSALCEREDLVLALGTLYALVRVGQQVLELPSAVAYGLTLSHHRALLPVADPQEKARIGEQAIAEGWTATALAEAVRAQQPEPARGRRRLPGVVKAFRAAPSTASTSSRRPRRWRSRGCPTSSSSSAAATSGWRWAGCGSGSARR